MQQIVQGFDQSQEMESVLLKINEMVNNYNDYDLIEHIDELYCVSRVAAIAHRDIFSGHLFRGEDDLDGEIQWQVRLNRLADDIIMNCKRNSNYRAALAKDLDFGIIDVFDKPDADI